MGKLKNSTAVAVRERNLVKYASPSKHMSFVHKDLKSTLKALEKKLEVH